MLAAALSAGAVLTAEAVVRSRVNRMPDTASPRTLFHHIQIRRANNRGLVGSRLSDRPKLVTAIQTVSTVGAVGAAAVLLFSEPRVPLWGSVGAGLLVGGALANTGERWMKKHVTDYLYLHDSRIPLLRRRIWNLADAAIFNGALLTAAGLALGGSL